MLVGGFHDYPAVSWRQKTWFRIFRWALMPTRSVCASASHVPPVDTLRELLRVQYLSSSNPQRWQREAELRQQLHERFYDINEAVREVAHRTVRASSLVENLNSRLRNYFTLRSIPPPMASPLTVRAGTRCDQEQCGFEPGRHACTQPALRLWHVHI